MSKKKIGSLLALSLVTASLLSACNVNGENPLGTNANVDVKLWSVPTTQKIMRDLEYTEVGAGELNYEMVKNEVEGAQVIITPNNGYDVNKFTVETFDLTNENGDKIEKESISVYLQKYMYLESIQNTNGKKEFVGGWMPDPLLPFEKAVEYGENTVEGKNQGLYVTVETETDTPAGTYRGNMKINVDGKEYQVPMSVEVWDLAISDEVHTKSLFAIWSKHLMAGELDASPEMYEKYYNRLLDYRISGMDLPYLSSNVDLETAIEQFVEQAKVATANPKVSAFVIPQKFIGGTTDTYLQARKEYLKALMKNSTEDLCLVDKVTYYYGSLIDEVQLSGSQHLVNPLVNSSNESEALAIQELEEEGFFDTLSAEFAAELKEKVEKIPNLLTSYYDEQYERGGPTYCPMFNQLDSQENRDLYLEEKELNGSLWWYGCVGPCSPHPTYHLDDCMLGSRIVSWMQYDYQVDGNLYWLVNEIDYGTHNRKESVWEKVDQRWMAGDGTLFYPGADYGIDGPVGSLRLEMIRDGNEEYEYFYEIEQKLQTYNTYYDDEFSARELLQPLFKKLYTGTRYVTNYENFHETRSQLGDVIDSFSGEEMYILKSIEYSGENATISFNLASGYEVKVNGQAVTGTPKGQGMNYTATMKMSEKTNYFEITLTNESGSKTIRELAGGKVEILSGFTTSDEISILNPTQFGQAENIKISYAAGYSWVGGVNAAKVEITSVFDPENPYASMTYFPEIRLDTKALDIDTANLKTVRILLYNDSGMDIKVQFLFSIGGVREIEYVNMTLKAGWNIINVESIVGSSTQLADVDSIILRFENSVDSKNQTAMAKQIIYLDEILLEYGLEG